jgi:hypothetical protein
MADKHQILDNLAAEKENLIPTPPVGRIVIWYEHGIVGKEKGHPAVVISQEGAGRVSISLLARSRGTVKTGVKYRSMDDAQNPANQATYRFGCWDYVQGESPTKTTHADYQTHLESISARQESYKNRIAAEANRPANKPQAATA